RAPESFTASSSVAGRRPARRPTFSLFSRTPLEEPRRNQALLDLFDAVAVRRPERRPARASVEALQVQGRLEPADTVAAGTAPVGQHHPRREGLGFLPPSL